MTETSNVSEYSRKMRILLALAGFIGAALGWVVAIAINVFVLDLNSLGFSIFVGSISMSVFGGALGLVAGYYSSVPRTASTADFRKQGQATTNITKDDPFEDLVCRLITYQEEATFLNALREATELAPKGDDLGVRALSEAVRRRCGGRDIAFYIPSIGGLTMRSGEIISEAESRLLEIAKSNRLLENPRSTQDLISAALSVSQDGLRGLVGAIFEQAGQDQGYDFQLLFNQMHSTIQLRQSQGERSWTQQVTDGSSD